MSPSNSSESEKQPSPSPPSRPITRSMLKFLNTHKSKIPGVVYRQTARIRSMTPYEATKGRQLAPFSSIHKALPKLKPTPEPMKRTSSSRKGKKKIQTWTSSEETSDDESEGGLGEDNWGVDESDEEERGDQDRRSIDEADNDSFGNSSENSINNDYFADDDGDDASS